MDSKEIVLKLTLDQINIVLTGLGQLPLKDSLQVFQEIQKQAQDQMMKKEEDK